ncbi:uncharacterized protein EDB91DRAFT_1087778 [Suillus paluster]|uniref:uncharacterized protein n=1 Tax=Suillus paluster TaxID=48578 RepID=UPI001B88604D|nr:uncharacterized protein EDB91DRAFT_1087778 [Suillus paluster]KAG1723536.1 hypothetical protein EDB91DRAFT_1087778 [Suillus paluster]
MACNSVKNIRPKHQLTPEPEPTKKRAKHARVDSDNLAEQLQKHERFWLADGNAVIELDGIRFRVHQMWLAQHSKRIAAMLPNLGKSGGKQIRLDFHNGELKASDFENLLLFYENPKDYRKAIGTPTLLSLIRAVTSLGFDSDHGWLVEELEALWPTNLEELLADPVPRHDAPEVAAITRVCDIDGLLRPAFHDMARTSDFAVGALEELEQISHTDILRLLRMREYLSGMWVQAAAREDPTFLCQTLRATPSSNDDGTPSPSENASEKPALDSTTPASVARNCLLVTARLEVWVRLVHDSGVFTKYQYDPLRRLAVLINLEWTDEWCIDCKEKRRAEWRVMQTSIWEKIDEYLGRS